MSTVFVAGATGRIGGPIVRLLIARGHHVVAGTRDPHSPSAAALARRGARIVRADFDDVASLAAAARASEAVVSAGRPPLVYVSAPIVAPTSPSLRASARWRSGSPRSASTRRSWRRST
jgi:nucleoside-diphosphate-sugar epimerase